MMEEPARESAIKGGAVRRKGYSRRADIPPAVLRALNEGREESVTLSEWLAIDQPGLLAAALSGAGLGSLREGVARKVRALAGEGVTTRTRGIGRILHEATIDHPLREDAFEALASHTSDMVRGWAAYMVAADGDQSLPVRLARARRFAMDPAVSVKECAWDIFRPSLALSPTHLAEGINLLRSWVTDREPGIRRCAVEATRPRGVWTPHLEALKKDPARGLPLLEPVRSDPSRYVQRAVAPKKLRRQEWVLAWGRGRTRVTWPSV